MPISIRVAGVETVTNELIGLAPKQTTESPFQVTTFVAKFDK